MRRRVLCRRLLSVVAAAVAPVSATLAETVVTTPFRGVTHYTRTEEAGVVAPRRVVMNIVKIDLADPAVSFFTTPGNGAAPGEFTGQRTSQFVQQHNLQIGLNADFFSSAGTGPGGEIYRDVTNLAASNGSLISPWPSNPGTIRGAINVSASNVPTLVRPASNSGGTFNTNPSLTPYNAVGGSDRMIDNGNIILTSNFANEVHPRTVIGYNATHLFLFTVDGRQAGYSEGMNLHEIAAVLKNDYGVTHALNLDGGGSTTLVFQDPVLRVVNRPSDGSERVNGNNFGVYAAQWPQWAVDGNGNWSVTSNWVGGVPNGVGEGAHFRNAISANRTISVDVPVTVGTLSFEAGKSYTIGGISTVTLDAAVGNAAVNVSTAVSHAITAQLKLNDPTDFNIATNGALAISDRLDNLQGKTINKTGAGTLNLSAVQNHAPGTTLNVNDGTLMMLSNAGTDTAGNLNVNALGGTTRFLIRQNLRTLNVGSAGVAIVTPGAGKTVKTKALSIADGGKFDLGDNNLIIDYSGNSPLGTATDGTYSSISGLIQSARAGGAWNSTGLGSSRAATTAGLTTLAIAEAADTLDLVDAQTATWSGHTVDATSLLVMYTYAGDANLDGFISADDYAAIDFAVAAPGAFGYANGDFNYDGLISADDYATIDFNLVAQGTPFPTAFGSPQAVPEPTAALATAALLALTLARSRRPR